MILESLRINYSLKFKVSLFNIFLHIEILREDEQAEIDGIYVIL